MPGGDRLPAGVVYPARPPMCRPSWRGNQTQSAALPDQHRQQYRTRHAIGRHRRARSVVDLGRNINRILESTKNSPSLSSSRA